MFGEPTCTSFGGRYQRRRPWQLSSFAIALQSEKHNAVQLFCIGLQCVPNKRLKNDFAITPFSLELGAILEIPVQSLIGTLDTGVLLRNSRIDTRGF